MIENTPFSIKVKDDTLVVKTPDEQFKLKLKVEELKQLELDIFELIEYLKGLNQ